MSNVSERVSPAKTPKRFAFAADGNVIPGVHVTVASLLQSLTFPDDVELHLFYTNWTDAQIESLSRTAQLNNRRSTLYCHRLDLQPFRSLRSVRGSIMNFAWFVIPEFFDDRVIILDTDLVVTIDLTPLASVALDDTKLCAAVSWHNLEQDHNWPIYAECGIAPNGPSFSGEPGRTCPRLESEEHYKQVSLAPYVAAKAFVRRQPAYPKYCALREVSDLGAKI